MNMQFLNYRDNFNRGAQSSIIRFNRKPPEQPLPSPSVKPTPTYVEQTTPNSIKMKWGAPTWYLLHTLAHKVKDDQFFRIRTELINQIIIICKNLPCPKCANHATEYLSKINYGSIITKDDLKNMLFVFHNEVNIRKGVPSFSYNDLDSKYSTAVTLNMINNFFYFFQDASFNVNLITNKMHRNMVILSFKNWLQENLQYFDL